MVNISYAAFCFDPRHPHCLKFQIGHGSGGVLRQSLINAETDIAAWDHLTADQVLADNFLCDCTAHRNLSFIYNFGAGPFGNNTPEEGTKRSLLEKQIKLMNTQIILEIADSVNAEAGIKPLSHKKENSFSKKIRRNMVAMDKIELNTTSRPASLSSPPIC